MLCVGGEKPESRDLVSNVCLFLALTRLTSLQFPQILPIPVSFLTLSHDQDFGLRTAAEES